MADTEVNVQEMGQLLGEAFIEFDQAELDRLTEAEREGQYELRAALYDYVDTIWERAKEAGKNPATDPKWDCVAGMRDLLAGLRDSAA
ncbi:hypothetical protein D5S17_23390 [Pseudonocardiaceae bacterium YIM PH 21723]|nr:hypothetical protein D5S17_23390 [Pseudonocardiaceae bacterium YIM PH 21723]